MTAIFMESRLLFVSIFMTAGLLASCGSNNGNSVPGATPPTPQVLKNLITIDAAGVVPVIGNNVTSSIIYVHNNSDQTISGIKYSAELNTKGNKFLNNTSSGLCSTIPAHQSCPLAFTTPALSETVTQGAALVTASYAMHDKGYTFSQVISFERVGQNQVKGALFNSGVLLNGAGNSTAYGTIYVYGSGQNRIYTVNSIISNKAGVKIAQGNLTGKQISSNYVSALEVSAPTDFTTSQTAKLTKAQAATKSEGSFNAMLSMLSSFGGEDYSSTSLLGIAPVSSGANLTSGAVPIINTDTAAPTGTLFIVNAGNEVATLGAITYPDGVSRNGGSCGGTLASGFGCSIIFSTPQAGNSGNITIPYHSVSGGDKTIERTIVWYNGKGEALLTLSANPNPVAFNATESANVTVSIGNIGGYNLSNIQPAQSATQGGHVSLQNPVICYTNMERAESTGTNLMIGGVCEYTINVANNNSVGGSVRLIVSGNYTNDSQTKTYSRILSVPYIASPYMAILNVESTQVAITGDGFESQTKTLTVTNTGSAPATISNSSLSDNPLYLGIENNGCFDKTLQINESCGVTLKLGPTETESLITGNATYNVTYSGGQTSSGTTAAAVGYTVQAHSTNITMTTVTVSNVDITGNGASELSSFQIPGYLSPQSLTLTYQNSGTTSIQITGINNTNSPIAWEIDTASSSCYNGSSLPSSAISPDDTCTIVFRNVLANYVSAISGGLPTTYTENISVPTLTFKASGSLFQFQPQAPAPINSSTIYVVGNQAIVTSVVDDVSVPNNTCFNSGDICFMIGHTVANATGYSAISIISQMESYFTGSISESSNCNFTNSNGITTQSCTLNTASPSGSIIYRINPEYYGATLHTLFSHESNQIVGYAPLSISESIPNPKLIFVTANMYTGNLKTAGNGSDGFNGADKICNTEAANLNYAGVYKALLYGNSTTTAGVLYARPDGKIVTLATDGDLNGGSNLQSSISTINGLVWTGVADHSCLSWTTSESVASGGDGLANAVDGKWWNEDGVARACNESAFIYCAQQ